MSKNRDLADIVGPDAETGDFLNYNSDGTLSFSNIPADITSFSGYTISASADPAGDTNPSAAGALWLNQSTGELYVCTDATAGANVWVVTTFSTSTIHSQGSNYGYSSGGRIPGATNQIENFPFTTAFTTATDVGDLTAGRYYAAGQSSTDYGYTSGGSPAVNIIDRFPFTSGGNAADIGNLYDGRKSLAGQSSETYGYSSGGQSPAFVNIIDSFPFTTGFTTASDTGNLTESKYGCAGQSSETYGYTTGGWMPGRSNVIEKFPFTTSFTTATDVGDLSVATNSTVGQQSSENGYQSGGYTNSGATSNIQKWPFASDSFGTASTLTSLTVARQNSAGQSSTDYGYTSGGAPSYSTIDRFAFASDTDASAVGALTISIFGAAGQQY